MLHSFRSLDVCMFLAAVSVHPFPWHENQLADSWNLDWVQTFESFETFLQTGGKIERKMAINSGFLKHSHFFAGWFVNVICNEWTKTWKSKLHHSLFEAQPQVPLKDRTTLRRRCKSVVRCLRSLRCRWSWFTTLQWALDENPSQWKEKWQPWHRRPPFSEQQIASHMVPCRGRLPRLFNRHLLSVLLFDPRHGSTLFFYYVTKLRCGSYNTTCPPGINGTVPQNLKCHFTDVWLIWRSESRSHRADHVAKHAAMRGSPAGQWLDRKKKKKKTLSALKMIPNEICAS